MRIKPLEDTVAKAAHMAHPDRGDKEKYVSLQNLLPEVRPLITAFA